MDLYMARQPIFDRNKAVLGYELLFRDGIQSCFPSVDGSVATSCVLSQSFFAEDIEQVVLKRKAFINFPENLLLNRTPTLFPKDHLVVEILETVRLTEEVFQALNELHGHGYVLALDDFVFTDGYEQLFPIIAIVKIDIRITPLNVLQRFLPRFKPHPMKLLAEKVETEEELQRCMDLGFDYFQGYFFDKPQTIRSKSPGSSRLALVQLMAEIAREELLIDDLVKIIGHDVGISYSLLRYINSAFFFRGSEISSIRQALLRLGEEGIRRLIPVLAMSHAGIGKPSELIRTAVIRAKFCEIVAAKLSMEDAGLRKEIPEWFLTGLFSVIDAILDEPMEKVLARISLSSKIRTALLKRKGPMADAVALIRAYETGDWCQVIDLSKGFEFSSDSVPAIYWEAVSWADALAAVL
ncbi:EAL and HDOD domain-containing protein [Desulfatirhabdium butyrativorans]|uniref:EAL and HDOD domain-containing protein n=1 Tax=Desulfatirhabdium butyrativorans TaxID=340467 RepID=UPI0004132F62|nr:EAL domain-containing protein [Desulfatirhabdium butyrativorans]